jgi:hypothetical protein
MWMMGPSIYRYYLPLLGLLPSKIYRNLQKNKQVNNPRGNVWNAKKTKAKISANGLEAGNNKAEWRNVYALKGFRIRGQHSRNDNSPGTIVYYYEITQTDWAFYE